MLETVNNLFKYNTCFMCGFQLPIKTQSWEPILYTIHGEVEYSALCVICAGEYLSCAPRLPGRPLN